MRFPEPTRLSASSPEPKIFTQLICFGLFAIPFFIWQGYDSRQPKFFLAFFVSLLLGLYGARNGLRSYRNIWILAFLAFIPVSFLLAPQIDVKVAGVSIASWTLQAFCYLLVFFLAHWTISSVKVDIHRILRTIVLAGTIMAVYAIFQWFGFEQFFKGQSGGTYATCGTFGTPVLLAPYLAMVIPIVLYLRKYIQAVLMIVVVFLCDSQIAYGSMIVSLMFLLGARNKRLRIAMLVIFVILLLVLSVGFFTSSKIHNFVGGGTGSTRFPVWSQIVTDVKSPLPETNKKFALTGFGLGSFPYLFHIRHPVPGNEFLEAHNDYLELFYNTGLIGLGLFLMGLGWFVRQCFPLDRLRRHLLASFLCIAIAAGGIFVWQNGAMIFYTLVVSGLLMRKE